MGLIPQINCCPKCESLKISMDISTGEIKCNNCEYKGNPKKYINADEYLGKSLDDLNDQLKNQRENDNQTMFL